MWLLLGVLFIMMKPSTSFRALHVQLSGGSRAALMRRCLTTTIFIVGKKNGGEKWIQLGIDDYERRLKPVMNVKTEFLKSDADLIVKSENARGMVIAMSEEGKEYTSREFSKKVYDSLMEGGSQLSFLIGGAEGLPKEIRSKFPLISLSRMTLTHQQARLFLMEQLYRASEINKGSRYHKD
jgi:23S rRNA (pseudouridine1915-N3)-methyltransferase